MRLLLKSKDRNMNRRFIVTAFTILLIVCAEGRKTSGRSRGSGSGRGSSKKTNYNPQPVPTSFSKPQASAPKPTLFGWQERPAQKSNTQSISSWQSKPSNGQSHSYPSSGTGLSGDKSKQPATHQESIQRNNAPTNLAGQQHPNNQPSHSYPSSNGLSGSASSGYPQQTASKYPQQQGTGLSGNTGTGQSGYPQSQGTGLSGSGQSGHSYPQQHGSGVGYPQQTQQHNSAGVGSAAAPPPYNNGQNYHNNHGNYYHPQGPPPPYTNYGSNYGGFGGHGPYNPGYGSQTPGYFGNYGKGTGMSRTGSALTGVGIAGAGIGTVLTGLALWNLARSTGNHHHTVIYDNRGQPVAVAQANDTAPVADSILADLVNCSLTISNDNKTEVLAIPCSIATSFTPEADVKDAGVNENTNDNTKCTITVLTKAGKEFMTTIPCSILLNTAAENNVTEPPLAIDDPINISNVTNEAGILNGTLIDNNTTLSEPTALRLSSEDINVDVNKSANLNCTPRFGEISDPINPCFSVNHNLTVIPLPATDAPQ